MDETNKTVVTKEPKTASPVQDQDYDSSKFSKTIMSGIDKDYENKQDEQIDAPAATQDYGKEIQSYKSELDSMKGTIAQLSDSFSKVLAMMQNNMQKPPVYDEQEVDENDPKVIAEKIAQKKIDEFKNTLNIQKDKDYYDNLTLAEFGDMHNTQSSLYKEVERQLKDEGRRNPRKASEPDFIYNLTHKIAWKLFKEGKYNPVTKKQEQNNYYVEGASGYRTPQKEEQLTENRLKLAERLGIDPKKAYNIK